MLSPEHRPAPSVLRPTADAAHQEWAARVRANNVQVDSLRETDPAGDQDFYAPVATLFRADPRRTDEPVLQHLFALAHPDDLWLDVGAGGGRYALPLALHTREVIALEPSEGMQAVLRQGMADAGIRNVRPVLARWPLDDVTAVHADVALISHVGYDIADIGPFLDGLERAARRLCVAVLQEGSPSSHLDALWPAVHGVQRDALPSLPDLLVLLLARGARFEVRLAERKLQSYPSLEDATAMARRQLWVKPGSAKDQRLQAALRERLVERDGRWAWATGPARVGVISWTPPVVAASRLSATQ